MSEYIYSIVQRGYCTVYYRSKKEKDPEGGYSYVWIKVNEDNEIDMGSKSGADAAPLELHNEIEISKELWDYQYLIAIGIYD